MGMLNPAQGTINEPACYSPAQSRGAHTGPCLQPAQTGYLSAEQAASLRCASHDVPLYSGAAGQSGAADQQPFSTEDEEMQAAFGRKLSLVDSLYSAQDRQGEQQWPSSRAFHVALSTSS